jgi:hypothetical protein
LLIGFYVTFRIIQQNALFREITEANQLQLTKWSPEVILGREIKVFQFVSAGLKREHLVQICVSKQSEE